MKSQKSQKRENIISLIGYKQAMLTKIVACLLIFTFGITNLTYGLDKDTFDRIRSRESGLKNRVEEYIGRPEEANRGIVATKERSNLLTFLRIAAAFMLLLFVPGCSPTGGGGVILAIGAILSLVSIRLFHKFLKRKSTQPLVSGGKEVVNKCIINGKRSLHLEDRLIDIFIETRRSKGRLLAVFDGHGGTEVADGLSKEFPGKFTEVLERRKGNAKKALRESIEFFALKYATAKPGSTLSIIYIPEGSPAAHGAVLGDSPVIWREKDGGIKISPMHELSYKKEAKIVKKRIKRLAREGRIYNITNEYIVIMEGPDAGRAIRLSRTIGDRDFLGIIQTEPEIFKIDLESPTILMTTDGLFSYAEEPFDEKILAEFLKMAEEGKSASELAKESLSRGSRDDITAFVISRASNKPQLAPKYILGSIVAGTIMGVLHMGWAGLPLALAISLVTFLPGWGIHELGHLIGGDFGKTNVKEMRAGPLASLILFIVTSITALIVTYLYPAISIFNIPLALIFLSASANYAIHIFADEGALLKMYRLRSQLDVAEEVAAKRNVPVVDYIDMILETREDCRYTGSCREYSLELLRRLTKAGIDAQIMKGDFLQNGKHYWVEDTRDDGYVFDAFPEGMQGEWLEAAKDLGDERFIIVKKGSEVAKRLYHGEKDEELTNQAKNDTKDDEEFYKRKIDRVSKMLRGRRLSVHSKKDVNQMAADRDKYTAGLRRQLKRLKERLERIQRAKRHDLFQGEMQDGLEEGRETTGLSGLAPEKEKPTPPKGLVIRALETIEEEFSEGPFKKRDFKPRRIDPDTGKPYSDTTIYSELNGLVKVGILDIVDRRTRPYHYILKNTYKRAPPRIKIEIKAILEDLPGRPTNTQLENARAKIELLIKKGSYRGKGQFFDVPSDGVMSKSEAKRFKETVERFFERVEEDYKHHPLNYVYNAQVEKVDMGEGLFCELVLNESRYQYVRRHMPRGESRWQLHKYERNVMMGHAPNEFEESCSLCNVKRSYIIARLSFRGNDYLLIANMNPHGPHSMLLLHVDPKPQRLNGNFVTLFSGCIKALGEGYEAFYNEQFASASLYHDHGQIRKITTTIFRNDRERLGLTRLAEIDGTVISEASNWPATAYWYEGERPDGLGMVSGKVFDKFHSKNIGSNINIALSNGKLQMVHFARTIEKDRPENLCPGKKYSDRWGRFSGLELGGWLILLRPDVLRRMLKLYREKPKAFRKRVKKSLRETCISHERASSLIMSALQKYITGEEGRETTGSSGLKPDGSTKFITIPNLEEKGETIQLRKKSYGTSAFDFNIYIRGELVGTIDCSLRGNTYHFGWIHINEDKRGKGVGRSVIDWFVKKAQREGRKIEGYTRVPEIVNIFLKYDFFRNGDISVGDKIEAYDGSFRWKEERVLKTFDNIYSEVGKMDVSDEEGNNIGKISIGRDMRIIFSSVEGVNRDDRIEIEKGWVTVVEPGRQRRIGRITEFEKLLDFVGKPVAADKDRETTGSSGVAPEAEDALNTGSFGVAPAEESEGKKSELAALRDRFIEVERTGFKRLMEAGEDSSTPMHVIDQIKREVAFARTVILFEMLVKAGLIQDVTFYPLLGADIYLSRFVHLLGVNRDYTRDLHDFAGFWNKNVHLPIEPEAIDERLTYLGGLDLHQAHERIVAENERLTTAGIGPIRTIILKDLDVYLTSPRGAIHRMDWLRRLNEEILGPGATIVLCNGDTGFIDDLTDVHYERVELPPELEEVKARMTSNSIWSSAADTWMGFNIHPILAFEVVRKTGGRETTGSSGIAPVSEDTETVITQKMAQDMLIYDVGMLLRLKKKLLKLKKEAPELIIGKEFQLTVDKAWKDAYPKQYDMVIEWWKALKVIFKDYAKFKDRIIENTSGKNGLIKITCKDIGKRTNGQEQASSVEIEGSHDIGPRIFRLLNMAFAASNIPHITKDEGIADFHPLIDFINDQYFLLTGIRGYIDISNYTPEDIRRKIRTINIYLEPIRRIDYEKELEVDMAIETLRAV